MSSGFDLKELRFGTLNNVQKNEIPQTGDRRRTSTTTALRLGLQSAFGKDELAGINEFNGIVVHVRRVTYPTYSNRSSLLQEYAVAQANTQPQGGDDDAPEPSQEYDQMVYKVYIPEIEPRCKPTSETDPILRTYADVYSDVQQVFNVGSLVVVRYEDLATLYNPRIVKSLGKIGLQNFKDVQVPGIRNQFGAGTSGVLARPPNVNLDKTKEVTDNPPPVIERAKQLGYKTFDNEKNRLWIYGIRDHARTDNTFNDILGIVYVDDNGKWVQHKFPGTTDPGWKTLQEPYPEAKRKGGTAILKPGQYVDTWKPGIHRGNYRALTQRRKVSIYRDPNRDTTLDMLPENIREGYFGINLHASWSGRLGRIIDATNVDGQSAGCQVFKTAEGFGTMMELVDMQIAKTGNDSFTYTLLDAWPAPTDRKLLTGKSRPEEQNSNNGAS